MTPQDRIAIAMFLDRIGTACLDLAGTLRPDPAMHETPANNPHLHETSPANGPTPPNPEPLPEYILEIEE